MYTVYIVTSTKDQSNEHKEKTIGNFMDNFYTGFLRMYSKLDGQTELPAVISGSNYIGLFWYDIDRDQSTMMANAGVQMAHNCELPVNIKILDNGD